MARKRKEKKKRKRNGKKKKKRNKKKNHYQLSFLNTSDQEQLKYKTVQFPVIRYNPATFPAIRYNPATFPVLFPIKSTQHNGSWPKDWKTQTVQIQDKSISVMTDSVGQRKQQLSVQAYSFISRHTNTSEHQTQLPFLLLAALQTTSLMPLLFTTSCIHFKIKMETIFCIHFAINKSLPSTTLDKRRYTFHH